MSIDNIKRAIVNDFKRDNSINNISENIRCPFCEHYHRELKPKNSTETRCSRCGLLFDVIVHSLYTTGIRKIDEKSLIKKVDEFIDKKSETYNFENASMRYVDDNQIPIIKIINDEVVLIDKVIIEDKMRTFLNTLSKEEKEVICDMNMEIFIDYDMDEEDDDE